MRLAIFFLGIHACLSLFAFPRVDIVLDMDELLFFLSPQVMDERDHRYLTVPLPPPVGEASYRVADGAAAFIRSLELIPGAARVSFFSTGLQSRNADLLRKLVLSRNESLTAFDILTGLFSRSDVVKTALKYSSDPLEGGLDPLVFPEAQKGNAKKDLTNLGESDLRYTVLLDDRNYSALGTQAFNLIWLPNPFDKTFWETWSPTKQLLYLESADDIIGELVRSGRTEEAKAVAKKYFQFRNQLFFARGLLQQVIEYAKNQALPIPDVIRSLLWQKNGSTYLLNRELVNDLSYYRRGRELMRRVDPTLSLYKVDAHGIRYPECSDEVSAAKQ